MLLDQKFVKPTVMVVDDDEVVREIAVRIFSDFGFEVYSAGDGRDALDTLEKAPQIGLLFTDVRMPQMDGPTLATETLKRRPETKVIFATGDVSGWDCPVDAQVLLKPYRPRDVARVCLRVWDGD